MNLTALKKRWDWDQNKWLTGPSLLYTDPLSPPRVLFHSSPRLLLLPWPLLPSLSLLPPFSLLPNKTHHLISLFIAFLTQPISKLPSFLSFPTMRLYVYVLEAKGLKSEDSYVKLRVGRFKSKTRVLRGTHNPVWNEEFVFKVHDAEEDLVVSVFHHDDDSGLFSGSGGLVGRVRIPVWSVAAEDKLTLPPTWFSLQSSNKSCGKILLSASLHGRCLEPSANHIFYEQTNANIEDSKDSEKSSEDIHNCKSSPRKKQEGKQIMKALANRLEKLFSKHEESSTPDDYLSEVSTTVSDYEDFVEERSSSCAFDEAIQNMQLSANEQKMPENLQGGVLLNQAYVVAADELNRILFKPNSEFRKELAELQGVKDLQEGPWVFKPGTACLTRVVSYINPPSKLVKAVKATEEQTYIIANGREFAVFVSVSTPEVPYGNTFKVELLHKILSGPELSSGEESSRLVVSWGINFHKSTMMKSMIEGGVRQGVTDSFDHFSKLLAQNFKLLDAVGASDKDHMLATLQTEHQSDWELASQYFSNFTVLSTVFTVLFVLAHILLRKSGKAGLEIDGLDLPDSFGEIITCGVLFTQLGRVLNMVLHFTQARLQRGSDHGVKARGDGWVLTVALIEGANLASMSSTGLADPYVVLTCNGKTRTSSVKLQTRDPQWKEVLEFDAMEEPPSVLDVEVYDFDGPFDQASSLGHAEINFLKHTSTELADMWVPLEGKLAQSSESKLHLRIFLDNSKGVETIKEYLTKMEKEVGKKLNLRSPQRNISFQKLFGLPQEEFLVSDFTCQLKRKLPLQGRLFLSARTMGFYANLFGYKTKFFLLWEDIENIQILPPTLATVGSPSLVVVVRKGRGLDARHGAKCHDEEGRLKFYFQSFVSFNVASRTIMALWRTRILDPDQEVQTQEELQDQEDTLTALEDDGSTPEAEGAKSFKIYYAELPISIKMVILEMFGGGKVEKRIMEKSGCLDYATSSWEPVKDGASQRHVSYKFNRHVSIFGGEVTSMQLKSPITIDGGWIVDEVMGLHNVPFGDCFRVHFKYQIEKSPISRNGCKCEVYIWITWLKSTEFEQRIGRNIIDKFTHRVKEIFELAEREILLSTSFKDTETKK